MNSMYLSVFFLFRAAQGLQCDQNLCPPDWRGDTICDLPCMSKNCLFDSYNSTVAGSDCLQACTLKGCTQTSLGNNVCNAECNIAECGWDGGDCGFCAKGCFSGVIGDGKCDSPCDVASCHWDGGDCVFPT